MFLNGSEEGGGKEVQEEKSNYYWVRFTGYWKGAMQSKRDDFLLTTLQNSQSSPTEGGAFRPINAWNGWGLIA